VARILFQVVFPIVLPALLYALWMAAERRRVEAGGGEKPGWADAPWLWLLALGLFFAGLIAVAIFVFGGGSSTGVYVPPAVQDGQVVPGHIEPRSR
jgi:hypothetical protein